MSRGLIIVGSGEGKSTFKIFEDNGIIVLETNRGVEEFAPSPKKEGWELVPPPKLEPYIVDMNPRGVVPQKYYGKNRK